MLWVMCAWPTPDWRWMLIGNREYAVIVVILRFRCLCIRAWIRRAAVLLVRLRCCVVLVIRSIMITVRAFVGFMLM